MSVIQTFSGRSFDLLAPTADMIDPADILNALPKLARFTGHTRTFYSVAQHSLIVASLLPPGLRLQGLLHDATEAYVGDLSRPLKSLLPDYQAIEARVWRAIAERFGLPVALDPEVKHADNVALMAERESLMWRSPHPWAPELECLVDEARERVGYVSAMDPDMARMAYRRALNAEGVVT